MSTHAVISDVHGNILALREVVADIKRRRINSVINLGDHLSGPLWPKDTAEFLSHQKWAQIAGNHDRMMAFHDAATLGQSDTHALTGLTFAELDWLKKLPATALLQDEILLFHGTPASDSEYLLESVDHGRGRLATRAEIKKRLGDTEARVMLCGHTHIQRVVEADNGILILNPGSVGLPAFDDEFPQPHVMESGSPHARYSILEGSGRTWTASLVSVPYDHHAAAEQARKNDRAEWAIALETGFMAN